MLMPYSASKAAVIAMSKSLAKELAGKGDITVNAISPAVIRTAILDGVAPTTVDYMISKIPMGRTGTIDEVAALFIIWRAPRRALRRASATTSAGAGRLIDVIRVSRSALRTAAGQRPATAGFDPSR